MSHPPGRFSNEPSSFDFIIDGEQSSSSSIEHKSILIKGSLTCSGDLIASQGGIKIDGHLDLTGDLTASSSFFITGSAKITGECKSESMFIKGSLDCPVLRANHIQILSKDLSLSKVIAQSTIFLSYSKFNQFSKSIELSAPEITIRYRAMYSRFMDVPSKLIGIFKKKRKFKKEIILENLAISCNTLIIETLRIPDDVHFTFDNPSLIKVGSIQVKRIKINPD